MAQALIHEPEVLILDEPTSGLDPNQIRGVRQTMTRLGKEKTILLSTHILQEVTAMASRVVMINEGRKVYDGPIDQMDPQGVGLDHVFANLTGHDPVSGAKLISEEDLPPRRDSASQNQTEPTEEELENDDESIEHETLEDETTEEIDD